MRHAILIVLLMFCAGVSSGGETGGVFFPDLLPANTILCTVPPDGSREERDYSQTIFARIASLPEMGQFLQSFEESRRTFAADIAASANVPAELAEDLTSADLGLALINISLGPDGKPVPEFAIALSLRSVPDRNTVFTAVMALLNRPEVVRAVLESQGIDPNTPLRTLAQEETVPGGPPILRIGPNIRIANIGNLVLLYNGPGADGIQNIFSAMANPDSALSRNASFQAAYRGAGAGAGSSLFYLNVPRAIAILNALNLGNVANVLDAFGFSSVQSLVLSAAYHQDGVAQTLFLHTPGGAATGLMSALVPMAADSPVGMEGYGQVIPSEATAFLALRVDIPTLLREIPYLVDTLGAVTRPGGMAGIIRDERILGVPLQEIILSLGGDVIIRPHDDTQVLMFQNVDIAAFENAMARMEQNAGQRFSTLNVDGYIVRYFNRRSSLSAPLAPAFCLVPRAPGSPAGILYMASHPQAVVSLIKESSRAREPLSATEDFLKTAGGAGGNFSLYYYNSDTSSYRRVYNFLLPVLSLWSSSARYPVDTGLLPTADSIVPAMFGSAIGVRCLGEGIQVRAYSPIGSGAVAVQLLDKLVVSNPLVIGYVYAALEDWVTAVSLW